MASPSCEEEAEMCPFRPAHNLDDLVHDVGFLTAATGGRGVSATSLPGPAGFPRRPLALAAQLGHVQVLEDLIGRKPTEFRGVDPVDLGGRVAANLDQRLRQVVEADRHEVARIAVAERRPGE